MQTPAETPDTGFSLQSQALARRAGGSPAPAWPLRSPQHAEQQHEYQPRHAADSEDEENQDDDGSNSDAETETVISGYGQSEAMYDDGASDCPTMSMAELDMAMSTLKIKGRSAMQVGPVQSCMCRSSTRNMLSHMAP